MFVIRQDQLDLFKADKWRRDAKAKAKELRKNFPHVFQFYTDEQLLDWVKRQFISLKKLGIDTEHAENTIITLFALFGENFERCEDRGWALDILRSPLLDADLKASRLVHEAEKRW